METQSLLRRTPLAFSITSLKPNPSSPNFNNNQPLSRKVMPNSALFIVKSYYSFNFHSTDFIPLLGLLGCGIYLEDHLAMEEGRTYP